MTSLPDIIQKVLQTPFSMDDMLQNVNLISEMARKIRHGQGGIGSLEDEMALLRVMEDLKYMVDMVDGLKKGYDQDLGKAEQENKEIRATYEGLLGQKEVRLAQAIKLLQRHSFTDEDDWFHNVGKFLNG